MLSTFTRSKDHSMIQLFATTFSLTLSLLLLLLLSSSSSHRYHHNFCENTVLILLYSFLFSEYMAYIRWTVISWHFYTPSWVHLSSHRTPYPLKVNGAWNFITYTEHRIFFPLFVVTSAWAKCTMQNWRAYGIGAIITNSKTHSIGASEHFDP